MWNLSFFYFGAVFFASFLSFERSGFVSTLWSPWSIALNNPDCCVGWSWVLCLWSNRMVAWIHHLDSWASVWNIGCRRESYTVIFDDEAVVEILLCGNEGDRRGCREVCLWSLGLWLLVVRGTVLWTYSWEELVGPITCNSLVGAVIRRLGGKKSTYRKGRKRKKTTYSCWCGDCVCVGGKEVIVLGLTGVVSIKCTSAHCLVSPFFLLSPPLRMDNRFIIVICILHWWMVCPVFRCRTNWCTCATATIVWGE